ncbi:hypothetical protein [Sulfurihydrogenibium sp.]|nr:hypothetical protein [Sulfurihydrogenibium sp.]
MTHKKIKLISTLLLFNMAFAQEDIKSILTQYEELSEYPLV